MDLWSADRPPEWLVESLRVFDGSNWLRLAVPLVVFSLLLATVRGRGALRLSDETLRSVTVTLWLLLINGVLARFLVLQVDVTRPNYRLPALTSASTGFWEAVPWPAAVLLAVLLLDVADYWTHRLMHNSALWGIHAVHHSEQRMTWLTSSRVHLLEPTVVKLGYLLALGWTGIPATTLLAAGAVTYLHNRYVHCDLGWTHGPLAKVIASPNWHRWHHSVEPSAYNKNYANTFSFLDVIFGTYHHPGPCDTPVGLREIPDPGVRNQLLLPFSYLAQQARGITSADQTTGKTAVDTGEQGSPNIHK